MSLKMPVNSNEWTAKEDGKQISYTSTIFFPVSDIGILHLKLLQGTLFTFSAVCFLKFHLSSKNLVQLRLGVLFCGVFWLGFFFGLVGFLFFVLGFFLLLFCFLDFFGHYLLWMSIFWRKHIWSPWFLDIAGFLFYWRK